MIDLTNPAALIGAARPEWPEWPEWPGWRPEWPRWRVRSLPVRVARADHPGRQAPVDRLARPAR